MFAMLVEDVFDVTGRGIILAGKFNSLKYNIHVNECLYDFCGNQFWVKGVEMIRRITPINEDPENERIGFIIEAHGKSKEYFKGKLLITKFGVNFIYPSESGKNIPEKAYECEYNAAGSLPKVLYRLHDEGYKTALIDIDEFESSGNVNISEADRIYRTFYRGPKLSPVSYKKLYDALAKKNYYLVNTPAQYESSFLISDKYSRGISAQFEQYTYYHAFFLNKRLIGITDYGDSKFLKSSDREEICRLAQDIDSSFFSTEIFRDVSGKFVVTGIYDGQIAGLNTEKTETLYLQLNTVIQKCRYEYTDPPDFERSINIIKENVYEFQTPVGKIIVTDENGKEQPFTVDLGSYTYAAPYGAYAEDKERLKYWIYPKNVYSISLDVDKLKIGRKYKAVFTEGRLEAGCNTEGKICLIKKFDNFSFAFSADICNDDIIDPKKYKGYLTEINDEYTGFDFELIDKKQDISFNISWLKNSDNPDECLDAVEYWVT